MEMAMESRNHDEIQKDHRLIAADRVEGTAVYNREGEKLGTVEDVMIDKISGRVAYAIMSFGGFLGIGDRHHPLPWEVLDYVPSQGGYVVDLDKERLTNAPQFDEVENVSWDDPEWNRGVHKYYGVQPTWM
jgi:sporulation protein YlmC with PRC-barrel domain